MRNDTRNNRSAAPTAANVTQLNPDGIVHGYSPYDSGVLVKQDPRPKPKDLRRLGQFLKPRETPRR